MAYLILGIVMFTGIHLVRSLAPGWREDMISRLGTGPWKGMYSLVALGGLAGMIWGYGIARQDPVVLYDLPYETRYVSAALMLVALILAATSDLPTGRIKQAVRHPLILATKIWAFAHLLVNGDLASLLLFGSLLALAVILLIAIKRRNEPAPVANSSWSDAAALAGGTALWFLFILWAHEWLFGIPAIA